LFVDVQVLHTKMLRFVNRVAGAIKRAAPGTKVTTGSHSMPYNSDVPIPNLRKGRSDYNTAQVNYWKDSMLVSRHGLRLLDSKRVVEAFK
jgi:endo-1,4-beta-mannosidase